MYLRNYMTRYKLPVVKIIIISFCLLFLAQEALADEYVRLSLWDQVKDASLIFEGRVIKVEPRGGPYVKDDLVTFQIDNLIVGDIEDSEVMVVFRRDRSGDKLDYWGETGVIVFAKWWQEAYSAHAQVDVMKKGAKPIWFIKLFYTLTHQLDTKWQWRGQKAGAIGLIIMLGLGLFFILRKIIYFLIWGKGRPKLF